MISIKFREIDCFFLRLFSCSVPTALKAELLHCLSALGKTSDIAFNIWQNIEAGNFGFFLEIINV